MFTDKNAALDVEYPRCYFGYCDHADKYGPKRLDGLEHYATKMMIQHRFQHHTPLIWIGYLCDVDTTALSVVHHRLYAFQPDRRQEQVRRECQAT